MRTYDQALRAVQRPLIFLYCGYRKIGLLGSFQASQRWTAGRTVPSAVWNVPLYRFAAAAAKFCRSLNLVGAYFVARLPFAQDGVPRIENITLMLFFAASWTALS